MPLQPTRVPEAKNTSLFYRPDIDGLRALAVLAVAVFHAFPEVLRGGFVGVDVFFVISGYLICGILLAGFEKGNFSFAGFYARRIRRLFPALIVVMLYCFAVGLGLPQHDFTQLCKHIAGGAGFVANFVLWNEAGYFDTASATKPLMHLWSLGVEEQFYILWPPLLYLAWKLRWNFLAVVTLITAGSFVFNVAIVQRDTVADFYSPLSRFWEIGLGGLLAYAHFTRDGLFERLRGKAWRRDAISGAGIILIATAAFCIGNEDKFPGWLALLPTFGAFCLIAAGEEAFVNRNLFARTFMVRFGLISFPFYLWHWPLLSFLQIYVPGTPPATLRFAALLIAALFAWLTYVLIEKPVRFGPKGRAKIVVLCGLMALVGCAGLYAYENAENDTRNVDRLNWPYWNDPACERRYGITPCQTNSAAPKIFILGDSHGNALYPGFAFTEPKAEVISAGTCMPLDGVVMHTFKNDAQNPCGSTDYLTLDKRILQDNPQIKTVVISARWRHALHNGQIPNPHERQLYDRIEIDPVHPDERGLSYEQLLERGLSRTLRYLYAHHYRVVFIRATPELDPEFADYCRLRANDAFTDCSIPRSEFEEDRKADNQMMAAIEKEFPYIPVYDPADTLCDESRCYFVKGGRILFRDNHHLSVEGSLYLGPRIKEWMAEKGLLPK